MRTAMYLIRTKGNWYQLRLTSTHFTLGCGPDLDRLLNTARNYVLKYGKRQVLERVVSNLSYKWVCNEVELIRREREYNFRDKVLNEQLDEVVVNAIKEVRQNTPMKQVKNRLKIARSLSTEEPVQEEPSTTSSVIRSGVRSILKKRKLVTV